MSVAPGPVDDPLGLDAHIRAIPDFPEPGITFRDLTPLLADGPVLARSIDGLVEAIGETVGSVDVVAGIEARGFLLGPPVALRLGVGFVPVRKPGKLPWQVEAETYALEYGTDTVEVHVDALVPGQRVLVVDDLVATGGTAAATSRLVARLGAEVAGFAFLVELTALDGRTVLGDAPVVSLLGY